VAGGGGGWGERPPCASERVPGWYYYTIHHWPSRPERGWQYQNPSHIGRLAQEKCECACHPHETNGGVYAAWVCGQWSSSTPPPPPTQWASGLWGTNAAATGLSRVLGVSAAAATMISPLPPPALPRSGGGCNLGLTL
jgi:hypothetical protein